MKTTISFQAGAALTALAILTQAAAAQNLPLRASHAPGHVHPPLHIRQEPFQPAATTTPTGLAPAQIRQAYGFDQLSADGTGQTIAIIDAFGDLEVTTTTSGNGNHKTTTTTITDETGTDWTTFCNQFGLPTTGLKVVYPQGTNTVNPGSWATETALDIEWAHAIAPGANILLVIPYDNSYQRMLSAVDYAVSNGANVVSMSWGGGDSTSDLARDAHFQHPSVTFVACGGDGGEGAWYPAVSPYVLGVGGTQLSANPDGTWSEAAWTNSGGGISLYEPMPTYQDGWQQFQTGNMRSAPDVCYQAGLAPGVSVYATTYGGWIQAGGTSVGAPQWAALIALANSASATGTVMGNNNSLIYSIAAGGTSAPFINPNYLFDIATGNNGSDPDDYAIPGYDFVTGLGSPMAANLVPALAAVLDTADFSLTVSPASATVPTTGGTVTYTVVISRLGGYSDGVNLSVSSSPALPDGATASFSPNPAADSSTLTLSVPANTTAGTYSLTITGTGTGTLSGTTRTAGAALRVLAAPVSVYVALPAGTNGYALSGGSSGTKDLTVTVALVDDFAQPVAGASVSAQTIVPSQTLTIDYGTGTTASDGTVSFTIRNAPVGTYTTTVTSITGTSLSWDGTTPANSYDKTQ
jgi:subtilase family serine protease